MIIETNISLKKLMFYTEKLNDLELRTEILQYYITLNMDRRRKRINLYNVFETFAIFTHAKALIMPGDILQNAVLFYGKKKGKEKKSSNAMMIWNNYDEILIKNLF